jgi:hypothetical protein
VSCVERENATPVDSTLVTQHGYDLRGALTSFHDPSGNAWARCRTRCL